MIRTILDPALIREFQRLLRTAQHIVLTCHVRPDGDAIGSVLGLAFMLQAMGKDTKVVTPDNPPRSLAFLPGFETLVPFTRYPDYAPVVLNEADMLICCDFNTMKRTDKLAPLLKEMECPTVLIDHHEYPQKFATVTFSRPEMSSTCELVFRIICDMGLYADMSRDAATCLATGIITDTRNLSVNCHDSELYIIMYELLKKGVKKEEIVKETLNTKSLNAFRLNAFAMSDRLTLLPHYHTAITTLSAEDLKQFKYERGDTEGLVNQPLEIHGIVASYFLREDPDCIKISARSINGFPVSRVCEDLFGGGGHIQASGGEYNGTLDDAKRILEEALPKYMDEIKKAYRQNKEYE